MTLTECSEFSDNIFVKSIQTCNLLSKRQRCWYITSKIQVTKGIFKSSPIHASVIYQIPEFNCHFFLESFMIEVMNL